MYFAMVLGPMIVLPILSAVIEIVASGGAADPLYVFGKWFLFWGAGVRLFIAGISQILRPQFTLKSILGQDAPAANQVVQELGFANIAVGIATLIGTWVPGWAVPVAIAPAVFLLAAGIRHILKPGKNRKEMIATLSDLLVGAVLAAFVIGCANLG